MYPKQFTFGYLMAGLLGVGCLMPESLRAEIEPAVVREGIVELSPKNCWIEWVGTHVGPVPDPEARKGTFGEFKGLAVVDPASQGLKSLTLEIKTSSLRTPIPKLTNHLKSPDFFDVREYPTAKFVSKAIQVKDSGQVDVVGDLTLHGVTREIRIPAEFRLEGKNLNLRGQLTLDRTQFGMDQLTDRVSKEVQLSFSVGPTGDASSDPRSARNRQGAGQANPPGPAARLKERDRDGERSRLELRPVQSH